MDQHLCLVNELTNLHDQIIHPQTWITQQTFYFFIFLLKKWLRKCGLLSVFTKKSKLLQRKENNILKEHIETEGRKTLPIFPSGFFGWSDNYIDIRQSNRRETNLICILMGSHKNKTQRSDQSSQLLICFIQRNTSLQRTD